MHKSYIERNFEAITEWLDRILPQGSGINCDWTYDYLANGKIKASNSYHCMSEHGFYDGYADFTIAFDIADIKGFRLTFNGKGAQSLNRKYMLRDYLDETIWYAVDNAPESISDWINHYSNKEEA